jgi:hypothetical protein
MRFRDALTGSGDDALYTEMKEALDANRLNLNASAAAAIKEICTKSSLRTQGVIKG